MIGAPSTAPEASADAAAAAREGLAAARSAQAAWARTTVGARLRVVRRARRLIAFGRDLAATVEHPQRRSRAETLSAEVLPLADACRFLERRARSLLRPRRPAGWGPLWLGGVRLEERREPLGVVLVVGPANYPLLLPGVQTLQALVAGNAVLLKPGDGGGRASRGLAAVLSQAGLPAGLLTVLPEEAAAARAAIGSGVDKVVFTGSAATGRSVLADLAPRLVPAVLELSGCDAVFVRRDADLELTARALTFGLALNGGATCMAPRRVFVAADVAAELEGRLRDGVAGLEPVHLPAPVARRVEEVVADAVERGARLVAGEPPRAGRMRPIVLAGAGPQMALFASDLMAPVLGLAPVADDEEALAAAARCPYALGASIFSRSGGGELAARVDAGVVVVNDLIAPTADPRLAFGGRGESGFGVTRGAAGLLEMTSAKTVVSRRGGWRPHLRPPGAGDESLLRALLGLLHGGPRQWPAALRALTRRRPAENGPAGLAANGEPAADKGARK